MQIFYASLLVGLALQERSEYGQLLVRVWGDDTGGNWGAAEKVWHDDLSIHLTVSWRNHIGGMGGWGVGGVGGGGDNRGTYEMVSTSRDDIGALENLRGEAEDVVEDNSTSLRALVTNDVCDCSPSVFALH